jgi:hypothetical protein
VKRTLGVVFRQRLNYSDGEAVLSLFEIKDFFTRRPTQLLFPLKDLFYIAVLDNRYALIEIKKPLNNLGNRVDIDVPMRITAQWRKIKLGVLLTSTAAAAIV